MSLLEQLTAEFLTIFEKCPSRLKKKIMASTEATKAEEERRAKGDISSSQYTVDYSVNKSSVSPKPSTSSSSSAAAQAAIMKGKFGLLLQGVPLNMPGN